MADILLSARRLVGRHGNDAVSMRDIAAGAGVPIASVYQYFPDKNAILRSLMLGYLSKMSAAVLEVLATVRDATDLPRAFDEIVDVVDRTFQEEREFATVWAAVQANTALRRLDVEDGRRIAAVISERVRALTPGIDPEAARIACLHAVHTIGTIVRVSHLPSSGKDGPLLVREFKTLLRLRLADILGARPGNQ